LLEALADDDPTVRDAVADALVALGPDVAGRVAPLLEDPRREATALAVLVHLPGADRTALQAYARSERRRALDYHGLWQSVSPIDDSRVLLLTAALRHRALRHAEHAVHALAPSGDHDSIDLALLQVTSGDATQRAYALETLEASEDSDLVRPLLAVWDPVASSHPATIAQLRSLLDDDDPWIRACAAFASGTFPDGDLRTLVSRLAEHDPDPAVRRAAADAVREDGAMKTVSTLSLMDRMVALQRAPLFRVMSPEDLKHVAESLTERVFVDGAVIASEGEPGDIMHVVVSGDVRVLRRGDHPVELARRGPGYIVGELAILAGQPRMADLVAVGDVRTVSIDRTRFLRILRERPDAALAVMHELSVRLIEAGAAGPI
jgi:Cyclic nucleotide-binding domain/HEAT repeats/HEAT repeat